MEEKLQVLTITVLSSLFAYLIDNEEMFFKIARWIPIVLGVGYTVWRWRKDYKKER